MRTTQKRSTSPDRERLPSAPKFSLHHILVPLDFSGMSRQALTCAVPLARQHHARISLIHVALPPMIVQAYPDGGMIVPVASEKLAAAAKAHLNLLATQLLPAELRGRTLLREGNPAYEVTRAAKAIKADLIVLSTTGSSGLNRVLLGSTAERIVRHAHCPVLTVRRHSPARSGRAAALEPPAYPETLPWRRILVPLDFSPTSLRALNVAVPLAQENDARLFLLNVVEPTVYPAWMEGEVLARSEETLASSARQEMPRLAQRLVPPPLQVTSLVGHGRAAGVIVETAERNHIDLIVLATHGHTGLDRLLLGSTAEHVVRQAKCPVFVVRQSRDRNQNAAEKG